MNNLAVEVRHLAKSYLVGDRVVEALADVSLVAHRGEFASIVGPSGSGKTTLLSIIAGLGRPDHGEVLLDGRPVRGDTGLVSYMPQRDALLPWRTVLGNVLLGVEVDGRPLPPARDEALAMMPEFGLAGFEHHHPHELSGGMRQRAALLRTYLFHRPVMLLDEPFGALDALTRRELQMWLLGAWDRLDATILFVTHDVSEAVLLSDRVYVLGPRPATVLDEVRVTLPRPRTPDMLQSPEFTTLHGRLLASLQAPG